MEIDAARAAARGSVLCPDLVGRAAELAVLRHAADRAAAGHGGVVFVLGEAGVGKSRLARAAAADAAGREWAVLSGRCVAAASPVAFRPVAEAVSGYVRAGGDVDPAELGQLQGVLGGHVPQRGAGGSSPAALSLVAVGEALLRFVRAVAGQRGVLLVLEDLHWGDPETLAIVEYVADNLAGERVLCVGTLRDGEPSPGLDLARTLASRRAAELVPTPRLLARPGRGAARAGRRPLAEGRRGGGAAGRVGDGRGHAAAGAGARRPGTCGDAGRRAARGRSLPRRPVRRRGRGRGAAAAPAGRHRRRGVGPAPSRGRALPRTRGRGCVAVGRGGCAGRRRPPGGCRAAG